MFEAFQKQLEELGFPARLRVLWAKEKKPLYAPLRPKAQMIKDEKGGFWLKLDVYVATSLNEHSFLVKHGAACRKLALVPVANDVEANDGPAIQYRILEAFRGVTPASFEFVEKDTVE